MITQTTQKGTTEAGRPGYHRRREPAEGLHFREHREQHHHVGVQRCHHLGLHPHPGTRPG
ncbi:hypothetical protein QJS66_16330 [Kocuria rhizophila]|nr:hypothetical protein QJS66_16330 [Kocuria rhizophila]